jgi:hypothetical protein
MKIQNAILIFSKQPEINRSDVDDPLAGIPWTDTDILFTAMLGDVVECASKIEYAKIALYRDANELSNDFLAKFCERVECLDVIKDLFPNQIRHGFENVFSQGYSHVVAILENNPLLAPELIHRIFRQLHYDDDCIILVVSGEGKVLLIGMKTDYSSIFHEIGNSKTTLNSDVLMHRLCGLNVMVFPIFSSYSLDSGYNVVKLLDEIMNLILIKEQYPHRTWDMFKLLNKKYKIKKSIL